MGEKTDAEKRAAKVLFDTYWSPAGWRRKIQIDPEEFAFAKAQGLMFDPVSLSHDEAVDWEISARDSIDRTAVANAFLLSLRSRRLDLRSALGSYATARHLAKHRARESPCGVCGAVSGRSRISDLNVFNFERLKWGGVRHDLPAYAGFDLSQLALIDFGEPSGADYTKLRELLYVARSLPPGARLSHLTKAFAGVIPSNEPERRVLISILGYCGILIDPSKPDFRQSYVPAAAREKPPWHKDDWPYPVCWWTGEFGIADTAVADWFPECP